MRHAPLLICALLVLGSLAAAAQSNDGFMNQIVHARYVYVTTENGDPSEGRGSPDDRRIAAEIQNQLQEWKRFIVVWKPQDADIVLAVRSGRIAHENGGVVLNKGGGRGPIGAPYPPTIGIGVGADASSVRDDLLSVYNGDHYPDSTALWRAHQKNGLLGKKMTLFEQFKKEVEGFAAKQAKKP